MTIIETGVWSISYLDLTLRIVGSLLLGGLIGLERELHNHAAGLRTHILVCMGSTAIMLLSIYGFEQFVNEYNVRMDPARLAAQVVSGVGFLGAGAIIRNGFNITGLTTAASIWVVAAIGLCVGAGFFYAAGLVTLLVFVSLFLLNKMEKRIHDKRGRNEVKIKIANHPSAVSDLAELFHSKGLTVLNMSFDMEADEKSGASIRTLRIRVQKPRSKQLISLYDDLIRLEYVISFETTEALKEYQPSSAQGSTSAL